MESQNILSWKGSTRIIQTQHGVPGVTGKLHPAVSCLCKTTSVFRSAQQCRGREESWNNQSREELLWEKLLLQCFVLAVFSLPLGQEQPGCAPSWMEPSVLAVLVSCSALGQPSYGLVWRHAVITPSVLRICLPESGVAFAAVGNWDDTGRAVVLLSLQLFGVNNVSGLLPWQGEGCSHFHVFYK